DYEINFKNKFILIVEKLRYYNYATIRTLKEYRELSIRKGWIRKSKSPCAINILVARK
ncbi:hypothetical protein BKA61DRAFT_492621, partial [Leptodontidium sp. MPI-SDFR-AT-0119]